MALANYLLAFAGLEQIWFVVSPQNPLKDKKSLLDQHQRLHLVNLAIGDHPRMRSSAVEFDLPQPSYTVHTLAHLQEKYPGHRFSLIIGQDNLLTFGKWKNHDTILEKYQLYVYPRPGAGTSSFDAHPHVHLTEAPLMDISSTFIRKGLAGGKDLRFFLPEAVWKEIDHMNFYRR